MAEPARRFAPADAFIGPRLRITYSRWARTDVSFGPVGRIVATVLLAIAPLVFFLLTVAPFAVVWLIAVWPILLPAIWKKTPLRTEKPPDAGGPR